MRRIRDFLIALFALLLVICCAAVYLTRDTADRSKAKQPGAVRQSPVDDRLLQTARRLASAADSKDEQDLAREALHLADQEVDQAFAAGLREAAAAAPPKSGPLKDLVDRLDQLRARVSDDQARIARLMPKASANAAAADQLELAKAQLALDQDEQDDAQEDLARQGGDPHAQLERALQEHEASQHNALQAPPSAAAAAPVTLFEQARFWLAIRGREAQVESAREQAAGRASALTRQHDQLEKAIGGKNKPGSASPAPANGASNGQAAAADDVTDQAGDEEEDTAAIVARLHSLSDQRKTLTDFDKRIQYVQQLTQVYDRWIATDEMKRRAAIHAVLTSLAVVLAIVLIVLAIDRAIRHAFSLQTDPRRLHQLRVMATIGVQLVGAFLILLVVLGPPTQVSTMIGLATAGLTLALKDFIVAFFGWFALMGRNGIRVGDWVEINGVGGEVVEIGLLKTVILEMGPRAGHPTGRRVAFVNSFAIEGHYFNFSTAGQWFWDELQVSVPPSSDPYQVAEQIRLAVEKETAGESNLAEQDWERVTRQYGVRPFSAKPAVDLRPSATGLDVFVRYITRAPRRYEVKSRLFQAIVGFLHKPVAQLATEG